MKKYRFISFLLVLFLSLSNFVYADDIYNNSRAMKIKSDNVGGIAIPGVKIVIGDDNTDGGYVNSIDGNLFITGQSYEDEISRGNVTDKEDFDKFGANNDVGTAIEDVWLTGGTKTYLSAAEQLKLTSASTDDDGAPVGTGARTVKIYGLDDTGAMIDETVTTDGTTAVTTIASFRDVYRMQVITSGTDLSNKGIITLKNNAQTATLASIGAGFGQTLMSHFTVPTGKQILIKSLTLSATGGKDVTVYFFCRPPGESWQVRLSVTLNNAVYSREYLPSLKVPAGSDIVLRAISVQAGGIVDGGWDSILEPTTP